MPSSQGARLISRLVESPSAVPTSRVARRHASYVTGWQSEEVGSSVAFNRS